jgi:hypothetical protein
MIAEYLEDMELTIRGLRAMAVDAAINEELSVHLEGREHRLGKTVFSADTQRDMRRLKKRVRYLTPLLKYLAAEEAVRLSRMAMQILGGNGYTKDYAPERLLRDALVLPIYEGTSQIQALMALKDNLGAITKNPQKFVRKVASTKYKELRASDPLDRAFYKLQSLALGAQQHIMWRVAKDKAVDAMAGPLDKALENFTKNWDPKRDFNYGLLHAERLIKILADVAIAEVLVEQAKQWPQRRELAERWIEMVEPRVRFNFDEIHSRGDRLLSRLERERLAQERQTA